MFIYLEMFYIYTDELDLLVHKKNLMKNTQKFFIKLLTFNKFSTSKKCQNDPSSLKTKYQ